MSITYALAKKNNNSFVLTCLWHDDSWYYASVLSGEKSCVICCRVSIVESVFSCRKFWLLRWMMVVISNGEHCCELFELFHKDSIQSQSQKPDLWIKFIAGPIIPSCRSWLLKIIPLPFAVRSKFSIHILLVCAMSGGEIRISVRSFCYLNSFVLDKRSGNWLEQIAFLSQFSIFGPLKIVLSEPFILLCLH